MRRAIYRVLTGFVLTVLAGCMGGHCSRCDAQCRNGQCGRPAVSMPFQMTGRPCECQSCPLGGCADCKCAGRRAMIVITGADALDVTIGALKSCSGRPRTFQTEPLTASGCFPVTVTVAGKTTTLDVGVFPGETTYLTVAADGAMRFTVPAVKNVAQATDGGGADALDVVNGMRAQRGLPPFQRAADLTAAALSCVANRARAMRHGHSPNDFAYLPAGSHADAAGAEGSPPTGWAACCTYERYREAGAAWCRDGRGHLYCQIYVR